MPSSSSPSPVLPHRSWRRLFLPALVGPAIALHFAFILIVLLHLDDAMAGVPRWQSLFSAVNNYSMVTFANRNFGFFAPGVTPDWNIDITTFDVSGKAQPFSLPEPSQEMRVKRYSMMGHFADSDDTMDLFARSWAVYAMNARPGTVRVKIDVTRNVLPSMQDYRNGGRIGREHFYTTTFEREPDPS